jgi:hypothetical protein
VNVGTVTFQVFADGVKIYDSGAMNANSATKSISVSVAGVQKLKLVVTDAGDNADYDHGDWAGARLLTSAAPVRSRHAHRPGGERLWHDREPHLDRQRQQRGRLSR